jgi:predicted dienelactone hydrolase
MDGIGYRTGLFEDSKRSNWQNTGPRPIAWSAWYPAASVATQPLPEDPVFDPGGVLPGAAVADRDPHPVALLSHGTGGTAESLGWLARALAARGYVVIGAQHHGNTGIEPYRPEGFLCWWERAADLSALLSAMERDSFLTGHLDVGRVSAVGFSLGAYAVLALAGAVTSHKQFQRWMLDNGITGGGPREMPDAARHIPELKRTSFAFRRSWTSEGRDLRDHRIRAVAAIAPPPPVRAFTAASLAAISLPVTLLTGEADSEAPTGACASWLSAQNSAFLHHSLGAEVSHYTFLDLPADREVQARNPVFADDPAVSRLEIHARTAGLVADCLV